MATCKHSLPSGCCAICASQSRQASDQAIARMAHISVMELERDTTAPDPPPSIVIDEDTLAAKIVEGHRKRSSIERSRKQFGGRVYFLMEANRTTVRWVVTPKLASEPSPCTAPTHQPHSDPDLGDGLSTTWPPFNALHVAQKIKAGPHPGITIYCKDGETYLWVR